MKPSLRLFCMLALVGLALLVLGAGFRAEDKPDGAALYKQKCSMCHGPDGKGYSALKTPDFTDPKWQESRTDKEIVEVIKNGKKDTAMLAFADKLKEEEIQAVVAQVRSFNSKKNGEKNEKK